MEGLFWKVGKEKRSSCTRRNLIMGQDLDDYFEMIFVHSVIKVIGYTLSSLSGEVTQLLSFLCAFLEWSALGKIKNTQKIK